MEGFPRQSLTTTVLAETRSLGGIVCEADTGQLQLMEEFNDLQMKLFLLIYKCRNVNLPVGSGIIQ